MPIVNLLPDEFASLEFYINEHGQVVDFTHHDYIDHEARDIQVRVTDLDFDQIIRKLPYPWQLELPSIELEDHNSGVEVKFQITRHFQTSSKKEAVAIYF